MLLFGKPAPPPVPAEDKLRNRTGIIAIVKAAIPVGQFVTLEEAIAILRRDW